MELCSLLAIYLGPNCGGGNEDTDDLLQKIPGMHCYTQCPNPAAGHHDPRLCQRPLVTHRQVWVSLLWGPCSFLLGPGAQGPVCALQESTSQSCVSSGSSMVGLMATSKRAYAMPGSAAPSHTQGHCTRSPCPCSTPLPTRTSSGDTQRQFCLSLCGVSRLKLGCISEGALLILSSGFSPLEHVNTVLQEFHSVTYHMLEA